MTILLIIFTLGVLLLLVWVLFKMSELDEREDELEKYSNKLAQWEQELGQYESKK